MITTAEQSQEKPRTQPHEQPAPDLGRMGRIIAVASGKGGVGKSTVTVNLAAAMAKDGLKVGVLDADIFGFSVPRMLGTTTQPTRIDEMLLPPVAHGVKAVSIGMFVPEGTPVVWRGPMLHKAIEQFLSDVFWGDLDVLLLDLPPGTGDIAISVAQLIPQSEIVVVTTPQVAAAEVAERAGAIALQTQQSIAGVVENMAWLEQADGTRLELFGSGGGEQVAERLSGALGMPVPMLGQVPIDVATREAGDAGVPVVIAHPESAAAQALTAIAKTLGARKRGLAGQRLKVDPS
jgi:ATP-binding protein involved in chromosome partitioning